MPKTLNNLKVQTPSAIVKLNSLYCSVWYKIKYHLDVCRTTNEVYFEIAQGVNKTL
jgi:hypothetical protein